MFSDPMKGEGEKSDRGGSAHFSYPAALCLNPGSQPFVQLNTSGSRRWTVSPVWNTTAAGTEIRTSLAKSVRLFLSCFQSTTSHQESTIRKAQSLVSSWLLASDCVFLVTLEFQLVEKLRLKARSQWQV